MAHKTIKLIIFILIQYLASFYYKFYEQTLRNYINFNIEYPYLWTNLKFELLTQTYQGYSIE